MVYGFSSGSLNTGTAKRKKEEKALRLNCG
jgi:hypothetical protein